MESDEDPEFEPNHSARHDRNGEPETDPTMECRPQTRRRPATAAGESIETVSRQLAVESYRLEQWRERALAALDAGLKDRAEDDPVQAGLGAAYKCLGELGMENELLREKIARLEGGVPFHRARSRR